MKLSERAKRQGISYRTAWRWVRQCKMPVAFEQIATGTIFVREIETPATEVALYAHVDDLVQDMIEVLTSFYARLYGRRSAKHKARKALEAMERAD